MMKGDGGQACVVTTRKGEIVSRFPKETQIPGGYWSHSPVPEFSVLSDSYGDEGSPPIDVRSNKIDCLRVNPIIVPWGKCGDSYTSPLRMERTTNQNLFYIL